MTMENEKIKLQFGDQQIWFSFDELNEKEKMNKKIKAKLNNDRELFNNLGLENIDDISKVQLLIKNQQRKKKLRERVKKCREKLSSEQKKEQLKEKYHNDPEFKNRIKEANKRYYEKKKQLKLLNQISDGKITIGELMKEPLPAMERETSSSYEM